MQAILECGHIKSVPDCCEVGSTTSCEECGEHENREIVDVWR